MRHHGAPGALRGAGRGLPGEEGLRALVVGEADERGARGAGTRAGLRVKQPLVVRALGRQVRRGLALEGHG